MASSPVFHLKQNTQKNWEHVQHALLGVGRPNKRVRWSLVVSHMRRLSSPQRFVSAVDHDRGGLRSWTKRCVPCCSAGVSFPTSALTDPYHEPVVCFLVCDGDLSDSRPHKLAQENTWVVSSHRHLTFTVHHHPTWSAEHGIQTLMKRKVWQRTSCVNNSLRCGTC